MKRSATLSVGLIGYGYWGPNLVRNFVENPGSEVRLVCDRDDSRLGALRARYPHLRGTRDYRDILKDPAVNLVVIATPVSTHFGLAREALRHGKNVLIEKPMARSVAEASRLIDLADKKRLMVAVDHTYVFTGAVRHMKEMIGRGQLGDVYYFDSVRVNLGLFQSDVNVIWDLAPHDFAIMSHLIAEAPSALSAIAGRRVHPKIPDMAYVAVRFTSGFLAHFHLNWISPVKIRKVILGGSRRMVVFDDLEPDEKIKVYDRGVNLSKAPRASVYRSLVQYRIGDMYAPTVDRTEALKTEINHLVECVEKGRRPLVDGEEGLKVVRLLEAAEKSLRKGGAFVRI